MIKREIKRKLIHLLVLLIPGFYSVLEKEAALVFLIPLAVAAITVDFLRCYSTELRLFLNGLLGGIMRDHEHASPGNPLKSLSAVSYLMAASVLCVAFFPKILAITALCVLGVSDTTASLVGIKYGRNKIGNLGKTLEGTAAFLISAWATIVLVWLISGESLHFLISALIASVVSTLAEMSAKKLRLDDNFLIPVAFCLSAILL